jgi:hypothetical protein
VAAGLHEQTGTPTCKPRFRPADTKPPKRRGSLTIRVDPAMARDAAPSGSRGRKSASGCCRDQSAPKERQALEVRPPGVLVRAAKSCENRSAPAALSVDDEGYHRQSRAEM